MNAKIILLVGVVISYGFTSSIEKRKKEWTLEELIKSEKAEVSAKCIYKGRENTQISITTDLDYPIKVSIPAGTLFHPENEGQQTLAIPKEELITVMPKQNKDFTLKAYCTERFDSSPSKDKPFEIDFSKNKKLNTFFSYLDTAKKVSESNIQESIWCITDNRSIGNVYESNDSELKKILSEITGQEIPWQSTKREIIMEPERRVVTVPQLVSGRIVFSTTKPEVIQSKIVNEEGELIHQYKKPAKVPKANNIRLKFNVRVKGFEQGKYYVIYYTESGKELVKKEFIV